MEDRSFVDDYMDYMRDIREVSQNTIDSYRIDLSLLFNFLDSKEIISIDGVKLQHLHNFITFCSQRGDAKSTRARRISSIKSFFRYLCNIVRLISENPAIGLETPRLEKRNPSHLSLAESTNLLNSIDGTNKERDYAIITLFLNCGMRLSELVSIDMDKIKEDTIRVVGKGNKERTLYLNDVSLLAIKNYLDVRPDVDDSALFISQRKKRIGNRMIQQIVKHHLGSAGLDTETLSTHSLRHTSATLMYKHGNVDIRALQDILGHESIATTQIYTHVDNEQLRVAVASNPLNIS